MLSVQKLAYPHLVTIYHQNTDKTIEITELKGFMDFRKNRNVDKLGSSEVNSFLLILPPCNIVVGDKVCFGAGPRGLEWLQLIPHSVQDLYVVRYVDPKYVGGKLHHIEVGG